MKREKKTGNIGSIFMFMVCLILSTGCKRASSITSQSPSKVTELSSFPEDFQPVMISPETPDTLAVDTVASDDLFYRGFAGYKETYRNQLNAEVHIQAQLLESSILLLTRVQEIAIMGTIQGSPTPKTFIKSTQVELYPSELRFQRNGEQSIPFVDGVAAFDLAAGEVLSVEWVLRASTEVDLCPFRAHQSFPNAIFPQATSTLQWSFVGSNLFGSFTRSVQAALSSGDTAQLISAKTETFDVSAGSVPVERSDRSLGCDGLMQIIPGT